ncbi:MAG: cell division protein ZapA [Desulfobacterales bacterium]|nr:cell division protein ZapA [Desulfobacterales bacterium]
MDEIIVIDLFGEEFRFKPDNQVNNPEQIALFLKKYIAEAEELFQHKISGKNKIAVLLLAAMNISKDFHELKMQHSELEQVVKDKLLSMDKKLDTETNLG